MCRMYSFLLKIYWVKCAVHPGNLFKIIFYFAYFKKCIPKIYKKKRNVIACSIIKNKTSNINIEINKIKDLCERLFISGTA